MNKIFTTLLALPVCFLLFSCGGKKTAPMAMPLEISVVGVLQQDVRLESEYTGQTYGESDIEINPRVSGLIQSINFKEGTLVNQGQVLYTIDPLTYENKVDQAAGKLAEARTNLAKTKADLDMIEPLAKINAVSQRELVSSKAQHEAAQGQVQSAEAALRNAKIELGYCSIVAPISGLIGITKVQVGDFVSQGPNSGLNTISKLNDIKVRFTISEQEFLRLFRELSAKNSALAGTGKNIKLILSDGTAYPHIGQFSVTDRQIDPSTGAMTLEAKFPNPDKLLRPGQYVKVGLVTDVRKEALVIPQRSVIEMQGIYQVFVLGDSSKVHLQIIKPGPSFADAYIVEDGLKAGDKIALGGTSLVKNGSTITPKITEWQPGMSAAKTAASK
ncbi:MAG: efflux RND transporter periplasmic adaptor subunit [Bacteroidota bacterium]